MTLTTYDEALCKKIEPNVSTTKERFDTLKQLNETGMVSSKLGLAPIIFLIFS